MAERSLIFPASEFHTRVARLRDQMARHDLQALLLTCPADIFYVTGFLTRFWESPARAWFVIVPQDAPTVAVIPSIGAALMGQTWIRDIRTWDAPQPKDDGVSLLAETLSEVTTKDARIGVPMGLETHLRMPLADYQRVRDLIRPRAFTDATDTVQRVREIKSEAEIDKIRTTCAIADRAFAQISRIAHPGQSLAGVFRGFQSTLLSEGADWVSYLAGGAGPDGYHDVISPATDAPLANGNVLMLDTGAVCDGYFCDFDRNFALGETSDVARTTHEALWDATEAALETMRPGMRAAEVHGVLVEALRRNGAQPGGGRLGHGLGITLTEWPSFTPLDHTILQEGMVLTLEPGALTRDGRMMVHEENLVLRRNGPELLSTRAPRQLQELPW